MNRNVYFIISFFVLLLISHLFLFQPGIWFFQDAGYWPKNAREAFVLLNQQFFVFNNYGYYLGYDQGMFGFTRILASTLMAGFGLIFGNSYSQLAFSVFGMIIGFISFYLFTSLFVKDKTIRYLCSLLYVFNPITYSLQGHTFYIATIPLFIYSFYKFYFDRSKNWLLFLLLNCVAGYFWVAYVRFLQMNFFIVGPYLLYLFFVYKRPLYWKKIVLFTFVYLLVFLPVIYSIVTQVLSKSQTAFFYAQVYGQAIIREPIINAFNLFPNISVHLYDLWFWPILGLLFFCSFLLLFIINLRKIVDGFVLLNLGIILFAVFCYAIAVVVGDEGYKLVISYLPFVVNAPFFAYYLFVVPLCVLVATYAQKKNGYLYGGIVLFLFVSLMPLLNLRNFELQKFNLAQLPTSYSKTFMTNEQVIPEGSFYLFNPCWRAKYMNDANVPTMCINWGLRYSNITLADPRLLSGDQYLLSKRINEGLPFDELQRSHNLKSIFIPNDLVVKKGPGLSTSQNDLLFRDSIKQTLDSNRQLTKEENENFIHYRYKNADEYDYFIYSSKLSASDSGQLTDNLQEPFVHYKRFVDDPSVYYIKVDQVNDTSPFMLGFNQTFSSDWQLYQISEEEYAQIECDTDSLFYPVTKNSSCVVKDRLFGFNHISKFPLLFSEKKGIHFKANGIGNGWLLDGNGEHYFMILNTKQIGFSTSIAVSFFCILIVIFAGILQYTRKGNE